MEIRDKREEWREEGVRYASGFVVVFSAFWLFVIGKEGGIVGFSTIGIW